MSGAVILAAAALSGCASIGTARNDASGSATALVASNAAAGAAERQIAASIVGAMAGGLVGGPIGTGLDQSERRKALEAEYRALEHTPSGQAVAWRSDNSGRYGEVVAGQPYSVGSQNCRQYSHTIITGGQPQTARGAACRNADGSWTPLT